MRRSKIVSLQKGAWNKALEGATKNNDGEMLKLKMKKAQQQLFAEK